MADTCPSISFQVAGAEIQVQACTPRAIRVRFFGPPIVAEASYVGRDEWPPVASPEAASGGSAGSGSGGDRVSTGRLPLQVDTSGPTPGLALFDPAGRRLLGTPARGGIVR